MYIVKRTVVGKANHSQWHEWKGISKIWLKITWKFFLVFDFYKVNGILAVEEWTGSFEGNTD